MQDGQPFLGVYCGRAGYRRTMMIGAGIAATGFVATAFAASVLDLLLWRSLCALGYAMVFVAAQGYVLDHSTTVNRVRSFALFVGAIMAASICGPSIGGILADNIGVRYTFGIAALRAQPMPTAVDGDERGSVDNGDAHEDEADGEPDDGVIDLSVSVHPVGKQVAAG